MRSRKMTFSLARTSVTRSDIAGGTGIARGVYHYQQVRSDFLMTFKVAAACWKDCLWSTFTGRGDPVV